MSVHSPNSQKAMQAHGSAPLNMAANLDWYVAQVAPGDPGKGSIVVELLYFECSVILSGSAMGGSAGTEHMCGWDR